MKHIIVITIILTFVASFAHALTEPEESMILYFSFDSLDGDEAIDHSKYGNNGELVGDAELANGKFGKALKLNGSTDWVVVPHDDILTVNKDVTVMAWINTERHMGPNNQRWQGIVAKGNNPRSYSFYTESPSECLHLSAGGSGSVCTGKIALNEWQHVVGQVDSGIHRYWLNGEPVGEFGDKNALPGTADTSVVYVGTTGEGANRRFLGLIDEVRIWNRALSEDEILAEMETGYQPGTAVDPRQKLSTTWGTIKSSK
ncbi:LamG domain-containing protein [Candidatus Poribacteria bacterium]|nr:LamG domain-containing protein [Candidatus Poribacteria bacterium]